MVGLGENCGQKIHNMRCVVGRKSPYYVTISKLLCQELCDELCNVHTTEMQCKRAVVIVVATAGETGKT